MLTTACPTTECRFFVMSQRAQGSDHTCNALGDAAPPTPPPPPPQASVLAGGCTLHCTLETEMYLFSRQGRFPPLLNSSFLLFSNATTMSRVPQVTSVVCRRDRLFSIIVLSAAQRKKEKKKTSLLLKYLFFLLLFP